jgi:hypothetical protein
MYIFYAATSITGASDDYIAYSTTTNLWTFRYNSGSGVASESFATYIGRRINSLSSTPDRITQYSYNPLSPSFINTQYNITALQKTGQTSTAIGAYMLIPNSYGTLTQYKNTANDSTGTPAQQGSSNALGNFTINGVQYTMYKIWNNFQAGNSIQTQITTFTPP